MSVYSHSLLHLCSLPANSYWNMQIAHQNFLVLPDWPSHSSLIRLTQARGQDFGPKGTCNSSIYVLHKYREKNKNSGPWNSLGKSPLANFFILLTSKIAVLALCQLCILAIRVRNETPLKIWFWPELLGVNGSEIWRIRHFEYILKRFS